MPIEGQNTIGAAHSSTAGTIGAAPQIGGERVQQGGFQAFKRAISDIGHTISNFFSKIASKFEDWQDARAAKAALKETGKAIGAANAVIASLKDNGGPSLINDMSKLMTLAARLNPSDPQAYASNLLRERLDALPHDERNKIITMDFRTLGNVAKAVADDRIDKLVGLESALQDQGMTEGVSDGSQMKTDAHGKIDGVLSTLVGVAREARLADLREKGDGLYNIDNEGNISGVVQNARVPATIGGGGEVETAVDFVLYDGRQKIQASKTTPVGVNGVNVPISNKAISDMPRMDLNLIGSSGTFNTYKQPIETTATKLRELTGSDSATTVLSGVLAQYPLRELPGSLVGNSGKTVTFKPQPSHYDQANVMLPDGRVAVYDHPGQINEAHVSVEKMPNGNFRVNIDWAYLTTRVSDGSTISPFDPETPDHTPDNDTERATPLNCARVHLEAQYVISGEDAANGQLTILPGSLFQYSFAGKVGLPSV